MSRSRDSRASAHTSDQLDPGAVYNISVRRPRRNVMTYERVRYVGTENDRHIFTWPDQPGVTLRVQADSLADARPADR